MTNSIDIVLRVDKAAETGVGDMLEIGERDTDVHLEQLLHLPRSVVTFTYLYPRSPLPTAGWRGHNRLPRSTTLVDDVDRQQEEVSASTYSRGKTSRNGSYTKR